MTSSNSPGTWRKRVPRTPLLSHDWSSHREGPRREESYISPKDKPEEADPPCFAYDYRRSATHNIPVSAFLCSIVLPRDVTIPVRELFPRAGPNEPCRPTLPRRHFRLGRLNKPWLVLRVTMVSGMDS